MRMIDIRVEAESRASPQSAFRLLRDGATWPRWSLFEAFELERPGHDDPLGVGAIRVFSTRVSRAREEIVEMVQGQRLVYTLLSGFPFQDYRAEIDLLPGPMGKTLIRWHSSFRVRHFATGWFWRLFMRKALNDVAHQLARAAEDHAIVSTAAELCSDT